MSKQNLTRIVGIWLGILLLFGVMISFAQELAIDTDIPITVTLGDSPVWLKYEGVAGETLHITTLTAITDTAPDTTLEILNPNGHRLAYADDVVLSDGTIKSDAILEGVELPIDGLYSIRVDSFNGVSAGEVEVILTQPTEEYSEITSDNLTIIAGEILKLGSLDYTLEVEADTTLSILARDTSGTLDPVLYIYDADDTLIDFNDDHQSVDLTLDVLDAGVIDLAIAENMILTVRVSDYLGRSGSVELIVTSKPS